jgi:hypothetical protein
MIEEWKSYSRYTKTVLTIYLILSFPLLPVMIPMVLFAFWVTKPQGDTRKITPAEVISFAFTMSLFVYILAACLHWCPPR